MRIQSKSEAQQRVDRIGHFRQELNLLEKEDILHLSPEQQAGIDDYHDQLIERLSVSFDIDVNKREKRLSMGMKIASFIGALAMGASVFFLFYQFWGLLPTIMQVGILIAAPILTLAATVLISGREKTGYFTKLAGLVCLTCFILNLSMLGQIFNITPSENAFLVWAIFAFLLAYASDARLLLAAGIISFAAFLSAKTGTWSGCYWIHFGERPENFFPAAMILFALSLLSGQERFSGFRATYRISALLLFFIPVLILSNWGSVSYIGLSHKIVEPFYQVMGFVCSAGAVWAGIRKDWPEVMHTGTVFFTIFLYTKFFDWFWKWMPKSLFFLVIGGVAVGMLLVFKRLRDISTQREKEALA